MINITYSSGTRLRAVGAVLVTACGLTACGFADGVNAQGPVTRPPTTSPVPSAVSPSPSHSDPGPATASTGGALFPESDRILAQYRAFFDAITPIWTMPEAAARAGAMAKLAVDPEFTTLLSAIKATRDAGEVGYGDDVLRPQLKSVIQNEATLVDCQDTSSNGRMKMATDEKVTQGRKNSLARVTMKRGADGLWRVATVAYAAAGSCRADG